MTKVRDIFASYAVQHSNALFFCNKGAFPTSSRGHYPTKIAGVFCNGTEDRLSDCDVVTSDNERSCDRVVHVVCLLKKEDGIEGDLRLVENETSKEDNFVGGRLEIYHDGAWGRVCAESIGFAEADVICHQLGFYGRGREPRYRLRKILVFSSFSQISFPIYQEHTHIPH